MLVKLFLLFFFISFPAFAHTFTGMIGFYDGLSHPVLGLDHFFAMVSVGIISAQIGGRAILNIPITFVILMIIGGFLGMIFEINSTNYVDIISVVIELGIILSVILLGISIAIEKKLPNRITMIFIGIFGLCHGTAHGMEMPWASNPILFALGFAVGTATLHLFGVGVGYFAIKTKFSYLILKMSGFLCAIYGLYLLFL